ncbi:MAG: C25 family cysteine peptidase [Bacteroidales bacterium]|jgi:hypothetical protein|nr:C25 family cysteine peptidase [Bacteroidales bacterium]
MKKFLPAIFIFFVFFCRHSNAQSFGNEWINFSQSYYKFYVSQNGVYRLNYNALISAGVPVNSINPKNIQIFNKGFEQHIFISGENDNVFNTGDYIEIYAEKNDGSLDAPLYKNPDAQANKNYSLFNDSSAYFITWNNSLNNLRVLADNDINFTAYTPVPYIYVLSRLDYTNAYYAGQKNSTGIFDPEYTEGTGWFDNAFGLGQQITRNIPTTNKYDSGPNASVNIVTLGVSNVAFLNPDHHLNITCAGYIIDTIFDGYKLLKFDFEISTASLGTSNTALIFKSINDLGASSDRNAISYIQVKYPHTLNLEGSSKFLFYAKDAVQAKSLFFFTNFNAASGDTVRLYDVTNHRRIKVIYEGGVYKCLLPNSGNEKKCFLTSDNNISYIDRIYPVSPDAHFINYLSIANTQFSDYFIITHPTLWDEAENYASYRNTTGYNALTVNVEHLYDQFAYGVLKSPLSIRNFIRYANVYFSEKPKHLFLIGKGFRAGYDGSSVSYRKSATYFNQTLVPSFGSSPSDLLFSQGIADTTYLPSIATGRLSAQSPQDVAVYLNKVMQFEQAQNIPEEWMKKVLHFGGGSSSIEQGQFAGYLENYKQIIEQPFYGAEVKTFLKTSSSPMQINQSDSLKIIINNGVSMMTFFGHAGSIGFDNSLDHPSEYDNYGKYPFILANSCYSGDIFLNWSTTSEEFVLIENKGSIAFLASIAQGIPWALNVFSNELYRQISYKNYGKTIGELINKTIDSVKSPDITIKETLLTMTLHGDPAIKLNVYEKPDYTIAPEKVWFDPPEVNSELDTFNINIISTNIGMAIADSFIIQTVRVFPDGSSQEYYNMIKAPYFKDTLSLKIPLDFTAGLGLNKFRIYLDFYHEIDELSETNNYTEVMLMIKSSDIVPVYPYKYAVIPDLPLTLKASTSYTFLGSTDFEFQLDTTDAFNSPVKQTFHITHSGGVVEWAPVFPITTDSIVYFWRVSVDSNSSHNYNWRESSFQYISGKRGWGQAHFYQFKNDDYQYVNYNKPQRRFDFMNDIKSIMCQTGYYPYIPWQDILYKVNNVIMTQWTALGESGNGMLVAVFDSVSGEPWINYNSSSFTPLFDYSCSSTNGRNALRSFISDFIPDGNYVLVYSHKNHNAANYEEELYQSFESLGSSYIRFLPNNIPYILFGKKGSPIGSAHEEQGLSINSIIKLYDSIPTKWKEGYILSEIIGPASNWSSMHWRQEAFEQENTDEVKLHVLGIRNNGVIDTLIKNIPPDSGDIYNLNTRINATLYPRLKLLVTMRDDSLHTPPQMCRWQVLYEGAPETALNPSLHYAFYKDTVQEGENILFSTATQNISTYDMDSLLIKYWVVDKNLLKHPIGSFRQRPHPAGDVLKDTVIFSTKNLDGLNSLWIEVNPDNDQMEQFHFNNLGEVKFYVGKDITNPILDVTFDGVHIMDGDIVSSKPEIQITLKDENKFFALNDTACFRVYIQYPGSTTMTRIYFMQNGQEFMQFIPAVLPNNSCKIIYNTELPQDGTYKLFVEAQDVSRNESGSNDYSISFEVINKPTITQVMNWPNPFTTATHFVFTITGSEIPTYFKIQIMTITGKVVREIDLSELGPIHIGRNITEYAWNGTDDYGDRLANGVYLYRVVTRLHGEKIELNPTAADQYFKKEFGKMFLMGN